ncbi:4-hydroxy-tetrahydrodipicolinate reductase [Planctomycetales bacterium]|nr:4-hydroxy-tetrahydrodipicolinate reductase [Planctomycetales bacterium]
MAPITIGISGAAGRMGKRLIVLGTADSSLKLTAATESEGHPAVGKDAGEVAGIGEIGLRITPQLEEKVDVFIDFSSPLAAGKIVNRCAELKTPLVFATTGTLAEQNAFIKEVSKTIPLLVSPSMSMTVNLAMKLCETAAQILKNKDADVEIIEQHHRHKKDAPSGTALKFGQMIADAMYITGFRFGREGITGERPHNEIAYHSVRAGNNPGEHTILFGLPSETLEISVKASDRDCYAAGAIEAAKFLYDKKPGLYSMFDVLKFNG